MSLPPLPFSAEGTAGSTMMIELVDAVGRAANLPPERAALAVRAMLNFFTSRLPSVLVGELSSRLGVPPPPA
jgi:hypothetical protein